jgi:hypothetical protein
MPCIAYLVFSISYVISCQKTTLRGSANSWYKTKQAGRQGRLAGEAGEPASFVLCRLPAPCFVEVVVLQTNMY